jgi:predicted Na+-dependent transporter
VSTLQNLFTFAFVLTSMLSMGLSLTVSQIVQPLRSIRLVITRTNCLVTERVSREIIELSRSVHLDSH